MQDINQFLRTRRHPIAMDCMKRLIKTLRSELRGAWRPAASKLAVTMDVIQAKWRSIQYIL
jgi:hypothetical protein